MTFDILNLSVSAAVQGLVGLGIWAAIQRNIEARDKRIEKLETAVEVRDARVLQGLQDQINSGRDYRKQIISEINDVKSKYLTREDHRVFLVELGQKMEDLHTTMLDLRGVATKVETLTETVESVSAQQFQTTEKLAAVTERIKDLHK